MSSIYKKRGMVLIELMIAMSVAALLMACLLEMYMAMKRSYQLQSTLIDIQDNAKMATTFLQDDIARSGITGCKKVGVDFKVRGFSSYMLTIQNKLIGNEKNEITLRYASEENVLLQAVTNQMTLYTSTEKRFSPNDILIISDCEKAEIIKIANSVMLAGKQKLILHYPLQQRFHQNAEISRFIVNTYFIGTNRYSQSALFMRDIHGRQTELVTGITKMDLHYTSDQSGPLKDWAASEIKDWSKVKGVAMALTLYSHPLTQIWYAYLS